MKKVLVIYATTHGHSARIAGRLGEYLSQEGLSVEGHEVARQDRLDPDPYEAVVVMASIHASRYQKKMADWVSRNAEKLGGKPSAFASVSLSAGSGLEPIIEQNREFARRFFEQTGWTADRIEVVAGCLQYPQYGVINRFLMKRLARKQGLPTDTTAEREYTDWAALKVFAADFARELT